MRHDAGEDGPERSSGLGRIGGSGGRRRRPDGKEALFSTAPTAPRPPQVQVTCRRCGSLTGVGVGSLPGLLTPPSFWNPVSGFLWGRCPSCTHRAVLDVQTGQALRALRDMALSALGQKRR